MNIKIFAVAMVLSVAVGGCGTKEETGTESAAGGAEQTTQPAGGLAEKAEAVATESAKVIEGNVESIEANIEKGQDQSTVTSEQFQQSEKFPEQPVTEQAPPAAGVVEEEVEVVEEKPAQ